MASVQANTPDLPPGPLGRLARAIGLRRTNTSPPPLPPSAPLSEQRLALLERRLHAAEARLARTQAMARVGSWEWSVLDGAFWWSDELRRLLGVSPDVPASYDAFLGSVHADDRGRIAGLITRTLAEGQGFTTTYRVRRPGGGDRTLCHEAQCVLGEDGRVARIDAVIQDMGAGVAQRFSGSDAGALAALGEVACGMAHELSQPLNILRMTAEDAALRHRAGRLDGTGVRTVFDRIAEQVDRMARVVEHIRIFSRRDTSPRCSFDAVLAIGQGAETARPQIEAAGMTLSVTLPAGAAPVRGRPDQFEQVVISLLTNAMQAIEDARALGLTAGSISLVCRVAEGGLRLVIADDGIGLPPGALGRLFEPFFTTKDVGRGSGLGLSVAYGIITGMDGTLVADGHPDGGARFTIAVPLSDEPLCDSGDRYAVAQQARRA